MASDLSTFGKIARDLARNPLGIIALFIVLIYGFAALLMGKTASVLTPGQGYILVLFLSLFPVVVLGVFAWLVCRHHAKLYAPADFADETHFLQLIHGKIEALPEKLSSNWGLKRSRGPMEYQILKTLWTKQVNRFPDYSGLWTFRINVSAPIYLQYREAASRLIGEGLISETDQGQLYLTKDGFEYCKSHHKDFPSGEWWPEETIDHEKLRIAIGEG